MGKANRVRRGATAAANDNIRERVVLELTAALAELAAGGDGGVVRAARRLQGPPAQPAWRRAVEREMSTLLLAMVQAAWHHAWQPADLARLARRKLGPASAALVRDVMAAELQQYPPATLDPRWAGQLADHEVQVRWAAGQPYLSAWADRETADWSGEVRCLLEVAELLRSLPVLQLLGPVPGTALPTCGDRPRAEAVDARILSRVRALLAKAESTTFPAEAETFTAGAQSLMARHSIDAAMVAASAPGPAGPGGIRIGLDSPYEGAKAGLLSEVARANRCRVVWAKQLGFATVVGFPADIAAVDLLFTSLLVQATTAMVQAGSRTNAYGQSTTRSFRSSFLAAYAHRIGERLAAATREQTEQAAAAPGSNLLPVLAARDQSVQDAVASMFPNLVMARGSSATNRDGWLHGRAAADRATLQAGPGIVGAPAPAGS